MDETAGAASLTAEVVMGVSIFFAGLTGGIGFDSFAVSGLLTGGFGSDFSVEFLVLLSAAGFDSFSELLASGATEIGLISGLAGVVDLVDEEADAGLSDFSLFSSFFSVLSFDVFSFFPSEVDSLSVVGGLGGVAGMMGAEGTVPAAGGAGKLGVVTGGGVTTGGVATAGGTAGPAGINGPETGGGDGRLGGTAGEGTTGGVATVGTLGAAGAPGGRAGISGPDVAAGGVGLGAAGTLAGMTGAVGVSGRPGGKMDAGIVGADGTTPAAGVIVGGNCGGGVGVWDVAVTAIPIPTSAESPSRLRSMSRTVMAPLLPVGWRKPRYGKMGVYRQSPELGKGSCLSIECHANTEETDVSIQIETIESQPFAENSYILWREGSNQAIVIDPGFEPEVIVQVLVERELSVSAILNTHGHVDHIAGNKALKEAFPDAPIMVGVGDAEMLIDPDLNLSAGFGMPVCSPPAERTVHDGETLSLAGMEFRCWEVPGHSPGHVVYYLGDEQPGILIGGDVLFRGSIGRTDFPGGSHSQLLKGIREKLWVLPDDVVVYPGHGPVTTIGYEKITNPYVAGTGQG